MAFSNTYIFGFAATVCVVCSLAVSSVATALKDKQDLNRERDLHANILDALQLLPEGGAKGEEIDRLWDERVQLVIVKPDGAPVDTSDLSNDLNKDGVVDLLDTEAARAEVKGKPDTTPPLLALYKRVDGDATGAWAFPVYGTGLWGPLSGYIALAPDLSEIIGVTFFAPKETPGLGAEIMSPPFKEQWKGKKIFEGGKPVAIGVAKGHAADQHPDQLDHWVDGVSGATITSRGVNAMVKVGIEHDYAATLTRLHK
ncbi:MAG: NADH:ubiquinone reductase (Na(+)-transporting) subunit C [Alphaproteobacteria bacterium]|nr:NADH:ubiquinone reductase (Na(+)-transporting) subunit C [Alphaproteobacteria bacterium]